MGDNEEVELQKIETRNMDFNGVPVDRGTWAVAAMQNSKIKKKSRASECVTN